LDMHTTGAEFRIMVLYEALHQGTWCDVSFLLYICFAERQHSLILPQNEDIWIQ
jgi:hypothetical protein